MHEEYNNVLSTSTEAMGSRFGRYRYIGKAQILAWYIGLADRSISSKK